jgi:hypothetical protein
MADKQNVEVVEYDQVKEMACIAFTSPKGKPASIWIHKTTFERIFNGGWDEEQQGGMTSKQLEMRDKITNNVKGNPIQWFDKSINDRMMGVVNFRNDNIDIDD